MSERIQACEYLILRVIYKYRLFQNRDIYMQIGRVTIWQALKEFDANKGDFTMYVYMRVKFAIIREFQMQLKVSEHELTMTDEKLVFLQDTLTEQVQHEFERPEWYYKLYTHEQRMIELLYYEGHSMKDLAKIEGVSYDVIKKRRKRLLGKIREMLETEEMIT